MVVAGGGIRLSLCVTFLATNTKYTVCYGKDSVCVCVCELWSVDVCRCMVSGCMSLYGQWMYVAVWSVDVCSCMVSGCMQLYGQWMYAAVWSVDVCSCMVSGCMQLYGQWMYAAVWSVDVCCMRFDQYSKTCDEGRLNCILCEPNCI